MVPDALVDAILRSSLTDVPFSDAVDYGVMEGNFRNFERMYRRAKNGEYFYGLPNVRIMSNTDGYDKAIAAIEAEVGYPVTIDYLHFRPPNNVHLANQLLMDAHGYDPETNILGNLTAQEGVNVYLDKLTAVYEKSEEDEPELSSRGTWEGSPVANAAPWNPIIGAPVFSGLVTEQDWKEGLGNTESVEVHYSWRPVNPDPDDIWEAEVQTGMFIIDLSGYAHDKEYYQAKYQYHDGVQNHVAYWTYNPEQGIHPELDAVFDMNYITPGTYFPFFMFRHHGENRTAEEFRDTEEFLSTEKMLKMIGMDFASMGESIHENPDVADVEQAVLMMGVPLDSEEPVEMEYLFEYFKHIESITPITDASIMEQGSRLRFAPDSSYALEIADADFRLVISYDDIKFRKVSGVLGPIGTYQNSESPYNLADNPSTIPRPGGKGKMRYIRKQTTLDTYEEVIIDNPVARYDIFEDKGTLAKVDDGTFLIPLDYEIVKNLQILKREKLYYRALNFVFNSKIVEKTKWYQSGIFKILLIIAAIVITIMTGGVTWEGIVAAFTSGTALAIAVTKILVDQLISYVVTQLIVELSARILGPELAFIAGVVTAMYGFSKSMKAGGVGKNLWADRLITASSGLLKGVTRGIELKMGELQDDYADFLEYQEEKLDLLEDANELLDSGLNIDPMLFFERPVGPKLGEAPGDFYHRAVHIKNPGPMSYKIVENFVSASLKLPSVENTLGGSMYV